MWFDRTKIGAAAREIADHLQLIEHIRALQAGQKEIADAISDLGDKIRNIEADMRVLKAETKMESLKETQSIINAVQGRLNERMEILAIKIADLDRRSPRQGTTGEPKKLR